MEFVLNIFVLREKATFFVGLRMTKSLTRNVNVTFLSLVVGRRRSHLPASLSYFFGFSYAPLGVCRCLNELKCAKPCCQCFAYLYYNYFWSVNTGSSVLRTSTSLFNHIFCSSVLRQPSSTSSSYDFFCGEVSAIHEEESCGLHTSIMINAVKRQPWLSMPSNLFADEYDCVTFVMYW